MRLLGACKQFWGSGFWLKGSRQRELTGVLELTRL